MKDTSNYLQDITEIRSMMERSSKFLSLSGWSGVLAGIYALSGALIAYWGFNFYPDSIMYESAGSSNMLPVVVLAVVVLLLAIGTAVLFSYYKASRRKEKLWNASARQMVGFMAVPLVAGGLLILIFIWHGMIGLAAPLSLVFYGLAMFNASRFTYSAVKYLGLTEVLLGLTGLLFVEYGLFIWALGFGFIHIIYSIYIYYKYER